MPDFCITTAKHSVDRKHLDRPIVKEEKPSTADVDRIAPRSFVVKPIQLQKAKLQTKIKKTNKKWKFGAHAYIIDSNH